MGFKRMVSKVVHKVFRDNLAQRYYGVSMDAQIDWDGGHWGFIIDEQTYDNDLCDQVLNWAVRSDFADFPTLNELGFMNPEFPPVVIPHPGQLLAPETCRQGHLLRGVELARRLVKRIKVLWEGYGKLEKRLNNTTDEYLELKKVANHNARELGKVMHLLGVKVDTQIVPTIKRLQQRVEELEKREEDATWDF